MCGRFVLATKPSVFIDRFKIQENVEDTQESFSFSQRELDDLRREAEELDGEFRSRFNIAPRGGIYAIARLDHEPAQIAKFRWGLIPSWAKDETIGDKCFNARAETMGEKPSFRSAFKHSRCAVLADGYYEWKQVAPKQKQPYFIHNENSEPMFFAGLFEPKTETATIVTTEADGELRSLHTRRPVFLNAEEVQEWLNPQATKQDLVEVVLSSTDKGVGSYPVSTLVNRATVDDPTLIEPIETLL